MSFRRIIAVITLFAFVAPGCKSAASTTTGVGAAELKVLAAETFLADIAQNVAGDRVKVQSLIPSGVDPHSFEPAPSDVAKVADSNVLIVNGAGFDAFMQKLLDNAGGKRLVIEASAGLASRTVSTQPAGSAGASSEIDPHFFMDPIDTIRYVENIRDGLSQADPQGADQYARNAQAYIARLKDLDGWIRQQVQQIPPDRRLLVTNHESLGYYADRYGFKVVGAIIPSVTDEASPSAQSLAGLTDAIRASGAPAIFLEPGTNTQLAEQVANESGVKIAPALYTHSTSPPGGPAPTYIDMLKYDTTVIVNALK